MIGGEDHKEAIEATEKQIKITLSEIREKLPELDLDMGLVTCSGDEEFYLELLKDFANLTIKEEFI